MSQDGLPRGSTVDPTDLLVESRRQRKSLHRLSRLIRTSVGIVWSSARSPFMVLLVLQAVSAAAVSLQVLVVKWLLDSLLPASSGAATGNLWPPIGALALLTAVTAICSALQSGLQRLVAERVAFSMWQRVLDVSTGVSLLHFESAAFFDRLERVRTSALTRPNQVTQGLIVMVGALITTVGVALAIASIQPLLLPLLILGGIPMLLTSRRESRLEFSFSVQKTPLLRRRAYLALLQTGRDEAKEVRAFGLSGALRDRFNNSYREYLTSLKAHVNRRARLSVLGNLGSAIILAGTLALVVLMIDGGWVSVAGAGAAVVAIRSLAGQITMVFSGAQQIFESGLFLDDLEQFEQFAAAGMEDSRGDLVPERFDGLSAERVSFRYPGAEMLAVDDVSIRLDPGEIVALVGENGSGKTTLSKIIAGLYDPAQGAVLWNGIDTTTLQRGSLRSRIAVIFQDFIHYALTAEENITLSRPDDPVDPARLRGAAKAVGIDDALQRLSQGYQTPLTRLFSGGGDLSGGQWQAVALARAYYRNAPLVILDEPTSALDPRAEYRLFESLRGILAGRTALFISHRFSTVRAADRIYVMEAGRVVECGSHDELMAANGGYADMFRLQASAYLDQETAADAASAPTT